MPFVKEEMIMGIAGGVFDLLGSSLLGVAFSQGPGGLV